MKCLRCRHDSKHRERSDGRCPKCRQAFAFEPQNKDPLTDLAFQGAIDKVSANGSVRFGLEHLRYEVLRRLLHKQRVFAIGRSLLAAFGLVGATGAGFLPVVGLVPGAVGLVLLYRWLRRPRPIPRALDFDRLWRRWREVHGAPASLIVPRASPPVRERAPDLGNYSFDRAVVCDRQETVDLLLANNFHFENNCAVLSVKGYPPAAFDVVLAMLKRNPRLRVFALHDATVEGCTLAHLLVSKPAWFPGRTVVDVGLRPRHAPPFLGLYGQAFRRVVAQPGISAEEAAWLSTYTLDLAAIRPEQVQKRLFRAINAQDRRDERRASSSSGGGGETWYATDSGDGYTCDHSSFSADAGAADGGADSFG